MDEIELNVVKCITSGIPIECEKEDYPAVRQYIHKFAASSIDNGQTVYSFIGLNEIKRLDDLFNYSIS